MEIKDLTVLIMGNYKLNVMGLKEIIRDLKFKQILTTTSGKNLGDFLDKYNINVLISDLDMENIDLNETLASLRNNEKTENIIFLVSVDETALESIDESTIDEFDGLLIRPYDRMGVLSNLKNKIAKAQKNEPVRKIISAVKLYIDKKDFKNADALISSVLKKFPEESAYLCLRAKIHEGKNELDSAIEVYKRVAKDNPGYSRAHLGLYEVYKKKNDRENMISTLENAININPEEVELLSALGNLYAGSDNIEASKEYFRKAFSLFPKTSPSVKKEVINRLIESARGYFNDKKFYIVIDLLTCSDVQIKSADYESLLSESYYYTNQTKPAIKSLERLLLIKPDPHCYFRISQIYYEERNLYKARAAVEEAINLRSKFPEAKELFKRIVGREWDPLRDAK